MSTSAGAAASWLETNGPIKLELLSRIVGRHRATPAAEDPDFPLFLLDPDGLIASWNSGAARTYGYKSGEAVGQPESLFYPIELTAITSLERLAKTVREEHSGDEGWQVKKDGSRFWANTITTALKDDDGALQGFARAVRDLAGVIARTKIYAKDVR